jgi:hypothetical protein
MTAPRTERIVGPIGRCDTCKAPASHVARDAVLTDKVEVGSMDPGGPERPWRVTKPGPIRRGCPAHPVKPCLTDVDGNLIRVLGK